MGFIKRHPKFVFIPAAILVVFFLFRACSSLPDAPVVAGNYQVLEIVQVEDIKFSELGIGELNGKDYDAVLSLVRNESQNGVFQVIQWAGVISVENSDGHEGFGTVLTNGAQYCALVYSSESILGMKVAEPTNMSNCDSPQSVLSFQQPPVQQ